MRCPKCGYNSFDHLDTCKKCSKDLTEHKISFNIQSILLSEMPAEIASPVEEEVTAESSASVAPAHDDFAAEPSGGESDDFGFDFMGDSDDDENLAFDELFEEVPSEEEVEETLPAPKAEQDETLSNQAPADNMSNIPREDPLVDDFSFDEAEPETTTDETTEFGFDVDEDPAADIFAETEEDFSLDSIDFEDPEKK